MNNDALFGTIVATGLTVAALHAALPTHWLPFVLAGRRQGWSHGKTLGITALAGGGHVLFTVALGIAIAGFGIVAERFVGNVLPYVAGAILVGFGLFYLLRLGHGHSHAADVPKGLSDRAVILALLAALTFSPCEGFLPVFVAGVKFGWLGFAVLCLVLAGATLAGMLLLTWLTLAGIQHLHFEWLDRNEGRIAGTLLLLLGGAILVFET